MFSKVRPSKNAAKTQQKTNINSAGLETHGQRDMATAFFRQKVFFWSILGSLLGSKIAPEIDPQTSKWDFEPPGGPEELQGAILGRFGEAFGRLWGPFWGLWGSFWNHF